MKAETSQNTGLSGSVNITARLRFEELKRGVGREIREIWDVYTDGNKKILIHIPISASRFDNILERRKYLSDEKFILLGIEVARSSILNYCSEHSRKTGCFWLTSWLSPDFSPTKKPKLFEEIKRKMEKGSGWLKGGPG